MKETIGIYPGSFDPVTRGHLDIIRRASRNVDHLIVGVLVNSAKNPLFTTEERVELIRHEIKDLPDVEVTSFQGLLVDFARQCHADIIIRGLRAVTDFEFELQMAQTNRKIAPEIDTIFYTTSLEYAYLSSSIVKEVAQYRGDISAFVTPEVEKAVFSRLAAK